MKSATEAEELPATRSDEAERRTGRRRRRLLPAVAADNRDCVLRHRPEHTLLLFVGGTRHRHRRRCNPRLARPGRTRRAGGPPYEGGGGRETPTAGS